METCFESDGGGPRFEWRSQKPSDSVQSLKSNSSGPVSLSSEKFRRRQQQPQQQPQVRGGGAADGCSHRVAVYVDPALENENRKDLDEGDEERELRRDEDEDGVHGDRMKPLASFHANRPSLGRRLEERDSPKKVAKLKETRRLRERVNSGSTPRLTLLNESIMNSRISRSYGKKRSRLKTGGVIQHAVNAGSLGSTDQLQRGGMDLLLMVLESGLVEAEEQQSHPSEISCQTQSIKSDLNQRISHYRAGEVPASRKFSEESFSEGTRFPCNSDAAQEIWEEKSENIKLDEEDSEHTTDDPIICSSMEQIRRRRSPTPPTHEDAYEDSDTHADSDSKAFLCKPRSRMNLSRKSVCIRGQNLVNYRAKLESVHVQNQEIDGDEEEIYASEATGWSDLTGVTIEPDAEIGLSLPRAISDRHTEAFKDFQHETHVNDSEKEFNAVCLDARTNSLPNAVPSAERYKQSQKEGGVHRSESSSSLRVFHEPSLIIAHDIRPSLIQPVQIVGRLNQSLAINTERGMRASPMEVDVGLSELVEVQQIPESAPQVCKAKRRKTLDHVSAFHFVGKRGEVSAIDDLAADQKDNGNPPLVISNCSESAFRKFEDPVHKNKRSTTERQYRKIQPCTKSWWGSSDNASAQEQALPDQRDLEGFRLEQNTCHNEGRQILYSRNLSGCDDGELLLRLGDSSEQGRSSSVHTEVVVDDDSLALSDAVTVAQLEGPPDAVHDMVRVVRVADGCTKLSWTGCQAVLSETNMSGSRSQLPEALEANRSEVGGLKAKASATTGKRRRRNVPLVASHFQDSHPAKLILSKDWSEPGEASTDHPTDNPSVSASTGEGSCRMGIGRKSRMGTGPRKFHAVGPRTKLLAQSVGNFSNYVDANSSLSGRDERMVSGAEYNSHSSCFPRGAADTKNIRQRRGQKKAQRESLKVKRSMSMAGKFKRLSEPSGFLGDFNPGIIQRVRNSQQIHAVLGALVGVATSKVANEVSRNSSEVLDVRLKDARCTSGGGTTFKPEPIDFKPHLGVQESIAEKDTVCCSRLSEDSNRLNLVQNVSHGVEESDGKFSIHSGEVRDEISRRSKGLILDRRPREGQSVLHTRAEDSQPPTGSLDRRNDGGPYEFFTSKPEHLDTHLQESVSMDENNARSAKASTNPPAACSTAVAGFAAQWLGLLTLDIKGRLSALKRSRRRVRALLVSGQFGKTKAIASFGNVGAEGSYPAETMRAIQDPADYITWASEHTRVESAEDKWRALFTNMDGVLCMEAAKLIRQMEVLCQDPRPMPSGPLLPIVPDFTAGKENCPPV
ncbi:hypothetical protein AXG93_2381s1330 [Marchantia polymorpha subsp. ruderalis]|uniref:Uncharacterized protein n=1 Tax=Marchantia polymorpha subsp. ruderalis TaxID=1480154 RepID=A0A176VP56_MARPO|nr:hypothetical protein AXG93_2381s1330 [Marchantia polymorpha subsp. ruderalis]